MKIDDIENAVDIISDGVGEISEVTPYVKQAVTAYKWVRKKRISIFLKSLDLSVQKLDKIDKQKFEKYITSDIGKEFLSEYSDTVLTTSSDIANSALGILYSDCDNKIYPEDIKRIACYALKGATDFLLEAFIELCKIEPKDSEGPYPVCMLTQEEFEKCTDLKRILASAEDSFACVNDLIKRSLFLPDHSTGRWGGGTWVCNFGKTEISLEIRDLLQKAKEYLSTAEN